MRLSPRSWLALAALTAWTGCVSGTQPHSGLDKIWRDYQAMPERRALAIAGDPSRMWVGAAAGGAPSQETADRTALAGCEEKRHVGRLRSPCLLYARGDEIVWRERAVSRR